MTKETMTQDSQPSSFKRLLGYASPHKLLFFKAMGLLLVATAAEMTIPWLMKIMLDDVIVPGLASGNQDWKVLGFLCAMMLALYAFSSSLQYLQELSFQQGALSVVNDIRRKLFGHLLKLPIGFFDKMPVGKVVSRVTNDTEAMRDLFVSVVPTIFQGSFRILGIFIAIALLDFHLMLLSLILIPILVSVMQLYRRLSAPIFDGVREHLSDINTHISESLQGMRLIQAFNQQGHNREIFEQSNEAWRHFRRKSVGMDSLLLAPFTRVLALFATVMVVGWFGRASWTSVVEIGTIYAFINYLERFFEPFRQLSMELSKLQVSMVSSERVFEVLDETPEQEMESGKDAHVISQGSLAFRNVSLSYDGKHQALDDISFDAPAGKFTAIVGHSGSGKSSIINLLMRFYQHQKGEMLIDGQLLSELPDHQLREIFGLVLQEPFIFSGSLKDNIDLANPDIGSDKVIDAAEQVQASRFIERLSDGYDHQPGYSGQSLSIGERQLLAFARTMAHDPRILLLDEATANIDSETETLIKQALLNLRHGRTTIAIAHRLSTIRDADQILVMEQGKVVQRGTHDELIAQPGHYLDLYLAQKMEEEIRGEGHRASDSDLQAEVA
ncbi:ABC transporter ATP-binding protein/permease [Sansalvadorimonas sp. 2012CJ34-2]|uniref:ABC transporter ATP-binding protein/permease n=1 Tax=Parendozoicomonas callyspongiae TaxID=2942213 RepID=A0ABT0PGZ1_9GAMM|nr:ABC transporter ATP-binding protein [Sansalvadorimonas sp. 2012CJ34-2]MCL6270647.1 ABC transporter ATP-binding protein/permease [Sansalvadorimonas sp. 2012CJ34-2]